MFNTSASFCETFGHDLETGASVTPEQYHAHDPAGKAVIKPAEYRPPPEAPDASFPFLLTTGRVIYHFHTRTKTARAPELDRAAPEAFVEICRQDAARLDVADGDMLELTSRRGCMQAPARIAEVLPGHLFVPFHYGYWDHPGRSRAANEITLTALDPVSKQPYFKYAAVHARKVT
jgi:anaerobic selenocysteine-containing dehydrogenase